MILPMHHMIWYLYHFPCLLNDLQALAGAIDVIADDVQVTQGCNGM